MLYDLNFKILCVKSYYLNKKISLIFGSVLFFNLQVSLCISILLSLTVFFLLLAEIIPPTSLTVPLLGTYLLFTMVLVTLSVVVTILVLNVNFRSPVTHKMGAWTQRIFIDLLPKVLFIQRPAKEPDDDENDDKGPEAVISGVFDIAPDIDKYIGYLIYYCIFLINFIKIHFTLFIYLIIILYLFYLLFIYFIKHSF